MRRRSRRCEATFNPSIRNGARWSSSSGSKARSNVKGKALARFVNVAIGQLGPIARSETRTAVVARLMAMMRQAHANGCDLIVYPELALTTFFPRWFMEDQAEIDTFFEREMPGPETRALFELARELGIGFYLGYAELTIEHRATHRYNTSVLV